VAPIEQLDAKPTMTPALRQIEQAEGQPAMLSFAADHGIDFDRLECGNCYGPAYQEGRKK
jgi:hypothetical protein